MTRYFMQDTPLYQMEQLMMTPPHFRPRGHGLYISRPTRRFMDTDCRWCTEFERKSPCSLAQCICLEERIAAGSLDLTAFVQDCFCPYLSKDATDLVLDTDSRIGENRNSYLPLPSVCLS